MTRLKRPGQVLAIVAACCFLLLSTACSSSFGGGSQPSRSHVIVLPSGQSAVCSDGTAPPCR